MTGSMLLLALACDTPGDSADSDTQAEDTSPDTDDTAIDTGDGLLPVDVCDNDLDDDGDGATDEAGCAAAWFAGEEGEYAGTSLSVAADGPRWWATSVRNGPASRPPVMSLLRQGSRLEPGWTVTAASDLAHIERFGIASHDGSAYVAYGYSEETRVERVPETGGTATPVVTLDWGGNASWGVTAMVSSATGLEALVPKYDELIARYSDVLAPGDLEPQAVFTPDSGCCFGREVALLENANGTGTTAALVLSRDPDSEQNHLYLYGAEVRGTVAPEDADAVFPSLEYGDGAGLTTVGDPDGDGYPDLSMLTGASPQVVFGPFVDEVSLDDASGVGGEALTGQGSLDGDDVDDLVIAKNDVFYLVHGPLNRESVLLSSQEAEEWFPVELGTRTTVNLAVVDLDGDGVPWLVAAYPGYGGEHGIPDRAGVVTVHTLPDGVAFD